MKLSNKIVLVTGGTSGVGLEAAKLFREEGATVIIVGQNSDHLQSAASLLGGSVTALRGDVSRPADIEIVIHQVREKFGRIDVVFANAGVGLAAPLEAVTEDQIDKQFDVNFKGVFFTLQKGAPLLAKGGSIVMTTSFLNEVGSPGHSILSATKAAARSLARIGGGTRGAWYSCEWLIPLTPALTISCGSGRWLRRVMLRGWNADASPDQPLEA
jgi:NAD(P)-dependent dehydrogenase (short-subunit alcohol dehydrogenase family)